MSLKYRLTQSYEINANHINVKYGRDWPSTSEESVASKERMETMDLTASANK